MVQHPDRRGLIFISIGLCVSVLLLIVSIIMSYVQFLCSYGFTRADEVCGKENWVVLADSNLKLRTVKINYEKNSRARNNLFY